jgi:hypothetical protein
VAAVATATVAILLMRSYLSAHATPSARRAASSVMVDVTDPATLRSTSADVPSLAVSSDGMTIAYLGRAPKSAWYTSAIYVRQADDVHAKLAAEPKEYGYDVFDPFFSPDGSGWVIRAGVSTRSRSPGATPFSCPRR